MSITKHMDVMDAFRTIIEDGNRIFLQDINEYDMRDVKIRENMENKSWDLIGIDDEPIILEMYISYFAVSDKALSIIFRLRGEKKEERKTLKLWF